MKKICFSIFVLTALASCNSVNESGPVSTDSTSADSNQMTIQIPASACYRYATANDTIFLKVEKFPNVVTGILNYNLKEKDKNSGEIDGVLRGDTLVADYTFMSEGTRSTRQVVFLIQDDTATEGYGEMNEENGKMVFNNVSSIDFSKSTKLIKVPCEN
jgi:hypothetical protein